ncbi:MAG: trigger factor [Candidatus Woesebacteria bacterium]|nr:trigger factor [Candidatus Woesebacteria bacterium]
MADAKITSTVAKEDNGNIQITFTIPYSLISSAQSAVAEEYAKEVEIPGFRKGNAPIEKVKEKIPAATLTEKALAKILPKALSSAINENKIKPAIYPKFELISANPNENWQVRAITCELPMIILPDYAKLIKEGIIKTPKEPTKEEKEQKAIKVLLDSIKINIPKLLVSEEVDARLSSLLQRIEKLGLSLEGYLGSISKTPDKLREEYELQAKNTISIELILNEVIKDQKIEVTEALVDEAIKAASADPKLAESLNTPEQRRFIQSVLARRAALDYLISLV